MRIRYTILLAFVCILNLLHAQIDQTSKYNPQLAPPSNTERYGVDYILKDYVFTDGDSSVIELLDLDFLEQFRKNDVDVIETDPVTGQLVLLYAARKKYH